MKYTRRALAMPPSVVVIVLSMLLGLQPVTTDLYLPALPGLTLEFNAPIAQAQLTLTALLLAFGMSQLIWGSLSDRFGRRPILLIGIGTYVLAALASTLANSIEMLIACRTVQGAAMGAAVICARATVRDLYPPNQGASVMSKAQSGLGIIACISAPMGGMLTATWHWRGALVALVVFGSATLLLIVRRFAETLPKKSHQALQLSALVHTWFEILKNPSFIAFTTLTISAYGGLFTFLVSSSFVFIKVLQWSTLDYGMLMFSLSLAYLLGTFICRWLLQRYGLRHAIRIAALLSLGSGTSMGVLALTGQQNGWSVVLPFYGFIIAYGVHQPCSQTSAIAPFPKSAGTASALNGFLMIMVAFISSYWMRDYLQGSLQGLACSIWFWSICIAISAWIFIPRYAKS